MVGWVDWCLPTIRAVALLSNFLLDVYVTMWQLVIDETLVRPWPSHVSFMAISGHSRVAGFVLGECMVGPWVLAAAPALTLACELHLSFCKSKDVRVCPSWRIARVSGPPWDSDLAPWLKHHLDLCTAKVAEFVLGLQALHSRITSCGSCHAKVCKFLQFYQQYTLNSGGCEACPGAPAIAEQSCSFMSFTTCGECVPRFVR